MYRNEILGKVNLILNRQVEQNSAYCILPFAQIRKSISFSPDPMGMSVYAISGGRLAINYHRKGTKTPFISAGPFILFGTIKNKKR